MIRWLDKERTRRVQLTLTPVHIPKAKVNDGMNQSTAKCGLFHPTISRVGVPEI